MAAKLAITHLPLSDFYVRNFAKTDMLLIFADENLISHEIR